MAKFIKLTNLYSGFTYCLNVDEIETFIGEGYSEIEMKSGKVLLVGEPPEEIMKLIEEAQA